MLSILCQAHDIIWMLSLNFCKNLYQFFECRLTDQDGITGLLILTFKIYMTMLQRLFTVAMALAIAVSVSAQKSAIFTTSEGAIRGYDAVAFFKEGKPVKGDKAFTYSWNNATWLFANKQDLDLFKANPEKYAPQYGGYCAYGTSQGHKAPTQPDTWTIVDGKLYFNYNQDVKKLWTKDQGNLIIKADKAWPDIKDKE